MQRPSPNTECSSTTCWCSLALTHRHCKGSRAISAPGPGQRLQILSLPSVALYGKTWEMSCLIVERGFLEIAKATKLNKKFREFSVHKIIDGYSVLTFAKFKPEMFQNLDSLPVSSSNLSPLRSICILRTSLSYTLTIFQPHSTPQ